MPNPLIRKLQCCAPLSGEERRIVESLTSAQTAKVGPKTEIIGEGMAPRFVKVILEGWCYRYKTLANGRRQILAFLLPGDICDQHVFSLRQMDHSLGSLTPARYAQLSADAIDQLLHFSPNLTKTLGWENLTGESLQREWTLNLGQRTAHERVAHLLCELFVRQRTIGLGDEEGVPFPITQADLGDATGMSTVHINRTLQELRHSGLIDLHGGHLAILDFERLAGAAMFTRAYLHIYHEPATGITSPLPRAAKIGPPQ